MPEWEFEGTEVAPNSEACAIIYRFWRSEAWALAGQSYPISDESWPIGRGSSIRFLAAAPAFLFLSLTYGWSMWYLISRGTTPKEHTPITWIRPSVDVLYFETGFLWTILFDSWKNGGNWLRHNRTPTGIQQKVTWWNFVRLFSKFLKSESLEHSHWKGTRL